MLLRGLAVEADTQFGVTDKRFRFDDFSAFVSDDWQVSPSLTLNARRALRVLRMADGARRPHRQRRFRGHYEYREPGPGDSSCPTMSRIRGLRRSTARLRTSIKADNGHTLKGNDVNNVAPRLGFAWRPTCDWTVGRARRVRDLLRPALGGLHQHCVLELSLPARSRGDVPRQRGSDQPGRTRSRIPRSRSINTCPTASSEPPVPHGTYQIRDGTSVTAGADGTPNPNDPATGQPFRGNIAETFEFRAVDRDLEAPWVQQYNFGVQRELGNYMVVEVRYVGTKGHKLLEARAFNQGYDLNAPDVPDHIYERFNQAYVAAGSPNGPLNAGATARARGTRPCVRICQPVAWRHARSTTSPTRRRTQCDSVRGARAHSWIQHSRGRPARQHRALAL